MASSICPDDDVFNGFLNGSLDERQLSLIEAHLAECEACGDTVRSLATDDTFSDLVRAAQRKAIQQDPAEAELLSRLDALADASVLQSESTVLSTDSQTDLRNRVQEVELQLSPPEADDEIGRIAHYRVLRLLGAGGMGVVYQAEDSQLKRLVALKILRPSLGGSARERFLQEAQLAAAIDHDNVVTIYNVGSEGPLAYLAMQWLDGETLEDRLKREGAISAEETEQIGSQVAAGLAAAHAKKLIHRDIKPANIWLEANRDRVRILDFGLAQIVDNDPQLTETGMIAGTPAYMSPEQAQGRAVDERSDLFSLGTMLYRMLTGKLPFDSANALATIRSIQLDEPNSPRQVDMSIPVTLSDTVMDLLEKETRNRPTSAEAIATCLQAKKRPEVSTARKPHTQNSDASAASGFGRSATGILALVLLGFAGWAAAPAIYRIATNQGDIVVESESQNVKVEVSQGGEVITVIDTTTNDSVTLKSGSYELQLKDNASDLAIEPNRITLKRNGVTTATVTRTGKQPTSSTVANGQPMAQQAQPNIARTERPEIKVFKLKYTSALYAKITLTELLEDQGSPKLVDDENQLFVSGDKVQIQMVADLLKLIDVQEETNGDPKQRVRGDGDRGRSNDSQTKPKTLTYEGKPYSHWYALLETEKSRKVLGEAIDAISHLVTPQNSEEIKDALHTLVKTYGTDTLMPYESIPYKVSSALRQLPPEAVADFVVEAIEGNDNSRKYVGTIFRRWDPSNQVDGYYDTLWNGIGLKGKDIAGLLLGRVGAAESASEESNRFALDWATECLCILSIRTAPDQETLKDRIALLEGKLDTVSGDDRLLVAHAIASIHPKSDPLRDSWLRNLRIDEEHNDNIDRIGWAIARMGSRAKEAVPVIVDALNDHIAFNDDGKSIRANRCSVALIRALGEIGPDAKDAIPGLLNLADPNLNDYKGYGIPAAARKAIGQIQPDAKDAASSETSTDDESKKSVQLRIEAQNDVNKLIEQLLTQRKSIRQAELDYKLKNTGKYGATTKKYKWYFDRGNADAEPSFRSDVHQFGKEGFSNVTEIFCADHYARLNHTTGEHQVVPGKNRGSNPLTDPRNAGLVSWFLESIDTHDDHEIKDLFAGERMTDFSTTKLDENLTRTLGHVVFEKDGYRGTRETVFDARQGNHPVLTRFRWFNPASKQNVVDTMEISSQQFDGVWFPKETIFYRQREDKEEWREVMTVNDASFNKPVDQKLFELESLLTNK